MKKVITSTGIDPLIYSIGKSFFEASQQINTGYFEPRIVNLALATELLLKSLNRELTFDLKPTLIKNQIKHIPVPRESKTMHGHDLKILFKKLTQSDQLDIQKIFEQKSKNKLETILEDIKDVFVVFRYSYEKKSIGVSEGELKLLCQVLINYIENRMLKGNYGNTEIK